MTQANGEGDGTLDAGELGAWLAHAEVAITSGAEADVPCGACTACCTSSQFVHIEPDEHDAIEHIPADLLFPAPGLPAGHFLLGYDERGRCPMLGEGGCTIYEHRPRTCRAYDCRVLAAADLADAAAADQPAIADRARRWRFSHAGEAERLEHGAIRSAATFLGSHREVFDGSRGPSTAAQLAALAIEVRHSFIGVDARSGLSGVVEPALGDVRVEVQRARRRRV